MTNAFSLAGKVALVIGGTSGIGKAVAQGFLGAGARVIVAGRTPEKLELAVRELKALGDAHGHCADVSERGSLAGLVASARPQHRPIATPLNSPPPPPP